MHCSFFVNAIPGVVRITYRNDAVFVRYADRDWELITEEQFAEHGNDKQHVTYSLLGITPAMVDAAFCRWWRITFR